MATKFELVLRVAILEKEGGKTKYEWAAKGLQGGELGRVRGLLTGEVMVVDVKDFYSPLPGRMKNLSLRIQSRGKYW